MEAMVGDTLVDGLADQLGRGAGDRGREPRRRHDEGLHPAAVPLRGGRASTTGTTRSTRSPGPGSCSGAPTIRTSPPSSASASPQRTDARLVMFPDSGHWWPVTKPAEVAAALESLWSLTLRPPNCWMQPFGAGERLCRTDDTAEAGAS